VSNAAIRLVKQDKQTTIKTGGGGGDDEYEYEELPDQCEECGNFGFNIYWVGEDDDDYACKIRCQQCGLEYEGSYQLVEATE
jgi:hypothetical protein